MFNITLQRDFNLKAINFKYGKVILDNVSHFEIFNFESFEIEKIIKVYDDSIYGSIIDISKQYLTYIDIDSNIVYLSILNFLTQEVYKSDISNLCSSNDFNIYVSNISEDKICLSIIDDELNNILIYDLKLKKVSKILKNKSFSSNIISFYEPENILAIYSNNKLNLIDLEKENISSEINYPFDFLQYGKFSPNGEFIFLIIPETESDKFRNSYSDPIPLIRIYNIKNNEFLYDIGYKIDFEICTEYIVENIYFSNDSIYCIAYLSKPGMIIIFDIVSSKIITIRKDIYSATYDLQSDIIAYITKENRHNIVIKSLKDFIYNK